MELLYLYVVFMGIWYLRGIIFCLFLRNMVKEKNLDLKRYIVGQFLNGCELEVFIIF